MSIIIFIIILSALVIVHELGHFLVAKTFGIRVDEFGLGLPPRLTKLFTWKGTPFTLNWLPFGGFVKIFGENPEQTSEEISNSRALPASGGLRRDENLEISSSTGTDSFQSKNRGIQALVLVAGVAGNFLFAWLLISLGLMTGLPAAADLQLPVEHARTVITTVLPASPATIAGLKSGDTILSFSREGVNLSSADQERIISPERVSNFIAQSLEPIILEVERDGQVSRKIVVPKKGILTDRPAIGISMDVIGIVKLLPHQALWYGLKATSELTISTGRNIGGFILQTLSGEAGLSGITGPVGLVSMVREVRELGLIYLLIFTALLSINLSLINLLPVPALDGGRLLFVGIEAVSRRSIPPRIFNAANSAGFVLLVILMFLITVQDLRHVF